MFFLDLSKESIIQITTNACIPSVELIATVIQDFGFFTGDDCPVKGFRLQNRFP